jgi:hypothetical protein
MSRPVVLPQRKAEEALDKLAFRHAKSGARMFGSSLADVFSTPAYDCRAVGSDQKPEFAVTRLRSGPRVMEQAPTYSPDQAILICVSLTPAAIGQWQALYNGKSVGVTLAIPFATTFIDLSCRMEMWVRGPFDYLHYYLSRELLERIALDNAVASLFQLREVFFVEDLVVAHRWKAAGQIPATSPESDAFSKDLKQRRFSFVGSTVVYAYMQSVGMVNDHLVDCFRYREIKQLSRTQIEKRKRAKGRG